MTNIIFGTVIGGTHECHWPPYPTHVRCGAYANVRHDGIQEFIRSIVPDLEIDGI